jgi:hypothetical protein
MARFEQLIERYHGEIFACVLWLLYKQRIEDTAMPMENLVLTVFLRACRDRSMLRLGSGSSGIEATQWLLRLEGAL